MGLALGDEIFSAESCKLNIPTLDGHKATRLDNRFAGSGSLDRTSEDDLLALFRGDAVGAPVPLVVIGRSPQPTGEITS